MTPAPTPSAQRHVSPIRRLAPAAAILLLATALRFHNLGLQSFWNDEGNTARLVERPIRLIIEGAAGDIHPPGYYLLLHLWRAAAGETEFALRAYSAFCGVLTVAVVGAIGRLIGKRSAIHSVRSPVGSATTYGAMGAMALAAIHPLAIDYSQEARMYAQLGLAAALTLWAAVGLVGQVRRFRGAGLIGPSIRAALALAAAIALGLYTQYAYMLALVALNAALGLYWLLGTAPPRGKLSGERDVPMTIMPSAHASGRLLGPWILAHILGALVFLPWAPVALGASDWRPPDLAPGEAIGSLTQTLLAGVTLPDPIGWAAMAVTASLALMTLRISLRAPRRSITRFGLWAALSMAILPGAVIVAAGIYRPAYLKFLMVSVAPLAVALAAPLQGWLGKMGRAGRPVRLLSQAAALALLVVLIPPQIESLQHLYTDPAYQRDDYRGIATLIRQEGRPGDAVLLDAPNQWEVFTYYYREARGDDLPVYPAPYQPTATEAERWVGDIVAAHQGGRLFVLYWGDTESDAERTIERALAQSAFKAGEVWITSVRLARYGDARAAETPSTATDITLGEIIRLTGYDVPGRSWGPGDIVPLTLFWRAEQAPAEPLKVFIHLVDTQGTLVAQTDMEPQAGFLPATVWQPGQAVVDRYGVLLPATLPPGTYTLRVGMYRVSGERLPVSVGSMPAGDFIDLAQVEVAP